MGLEEFISFVFVPDHWIEMTWIGAFGGFHRVGCVLIHLQCVLKSLKLSTKLLALMFCSSATIKFEVGIKMVKLILSASAGCSCGTQTITFKSYQRKRLLSSTFPSLPNGTWLLWEPDTFLV